MRTTKPDRYSPSVKRAYDDLCAGRVSPAEFASIIGIVWRLRRAGFLCEAR